MPTNPKDKPAEDDDDMDLFGSDDEDPEVAKQREANLQAYKAKKANKPKPIAKSLVSLEVKPWGMYFIWIRLIYMALTCF